VRETQREIDRETERFCFEIINTVHVQSCLYGMCLSCPFWGYLRFSALIVYADLDMFTTTA